jgi:hypothetical protein
MVKQIHTYPIDQRRDVEVLVDGTWYSGELRQWIDTDGVRRSLETSGRWAVRTGVDHVGVRTPDSSHGDEQCGP